MKTMRKMFDSKKGFTLIEMVITTLVLSILMGITMGMITSSGRMFSSTSELAIDKMVGDSVFETLESMAKYATHIEIADPGTVQEPGLQCTEKSYSQGFYVKISDEENNSGALRYDAKSQDARKYPAVPYSDSFYQGRTIKYIAEPYEYPLAEGEQTARKSNKHLTITVIVCRDGKEVFKRSNTIKCVNLGLLGAGDSANLIVSSYTAKENQYINFTCGEQLVLSEVDGYDVFSKATMTVTEYNYINEVLAAELNEAMNNTQIGESERKAMMILASTKAKEEIKELFGGFVPSEKNQDQSSIMHYFNGVQASREEVFYGVLKGNYSVDGEVKASSFQKFKEPETFFKYTTFTKYGHDMVQLILFIMNEGASYDAQTKIFSPSQILDFNVYSVRWRDWFVNSSNQVINLNKAANSLGGARGTDRSFYNSYTVFHPYRNTWYYQPAKSTTLGVWWNNLWGTDDKPITYNIGVKSSAAVMTDIDSNIVEASKEIWLGFGWWKVKITEIDTTSSTLWNALPASRIDLPG